MRPVTLTMTTCRRYDLFVRTFQSFLEKCEDLDLIDGCICVDDNSSGEDRVKMATAIGSAFGRDNGLLICKHPVDRGLGQSLNLLWDSVSTQYIFHLEDDWEFIKSGKFITEALKIIQNTDHVKNVLVRRHDMFPLKYTKKGDYYFECQKGVDLTGQVRGHFYSLNPSVQDLKYLREHYGKFNLTNVEDSFGDKYYADGLRTATLTHDYVKHIGDGASAFDINWTPR